MTIKVRLTETAAVAIWVMMIWSAFWMLTAFMLWGHHLHIGSEAAFGAGADALDWSYFNYD